MALITQTAENYYGGSDLGNYQFITIKDIINNFMIAYVGEDKLISKIKRTDVAFHTQRAIQEFSFDTLPAEKAIEIEMTASLTFDLPQDYVNYTKVSYTGSDGIEYMLYPTRNTSNPDAPVQDANGDYTFDGSGNLTLASESETWKKFKANDVTTDDDKKTTLSDADMFNMYRFGNRYGINPEEAQGNGVFYIDNKAGVMRFSSNMVDQIVTLHYISDGLGTDDEMKVHKFAEQAMYMYIVHAILSTRANVPEYQIARYKKELKAAKRNAKLRLSNLKIAELAQVMRNQAKWIKH